MRGWVLGLISAVFLAVPHTAQAQDSWSISAEQLSCIVDNHEIYLGQESDPVVIVVQACSETDPGLALVDASRTSGFFKLNKGDDVIVLSKAELSCLVEMAATMPKTGADTVDILKEGLCEQASERQ